MCSTFFRFSTYQEGNKFPFFLLAEVDCDTSVLLPAEMNAVKIPFIHS